MTVTPQPSPPSPLSFERRGRTWTVTYRSASAWPVILIARSVYPGTDRLLTTLTLGLRNEATHSYAKVLTDHLDLFTAARRRNFAKEAARRLKPVSDEHTSEEALADGVTALLDGLLEHLLEQQHQIDIISAVDIELPDEEDLSPPYALWPLIPASRPGMLVAPSGSGKSSLALMAGAVIVTGSSPLRRLEPRTQGPVIYVGQEETQQQWKARLVMMCRGLGVPVPRDYYYLKLRGSSIIEAAELIAEEAATRRAVTVIIDSAQATWGDGGDRGLREYATQWYNAVDEIGVPALVIEHPPEADRRKGGTMNVAGAGVKRDRVGHQWTMQSLELPYNDGEPIRYHVTLTDTKRNYVAQQREIVYQTVIKGFQWVRFEEAGELTPESIVEVSKTWTRVAEVMRDASEQRADFGWNVAEIAGRLGAKDDRRIRMELEVDAWRPNPDDPTVEERTVKVPGTGTSRTNPTRYQLVSRPAHTQDRMFDEAPEPEEEEA